MEIKDYFGQGKERRKKLNCREQSMNIKLKLIKMQT